MIRWLFPLVIILLYLLLWPTGLDPVEWEVPETVGYANEYSVNHRIKDADMLPLDKYHGPEDFALDQSGYLYTGTEDGSILRWLLADISESEVVPEPDVWHNTGGRPLGLEFDAEGNLIIADAIKGLISVSPEGKQSVLVKEVNGQPVVYADDLDITQDGRIVFTDASTKFSPIDAGGSLPASLNDLMEHGGHGRVYSYNPETGITEELANNLNFPNGVAITEDQRWALVNETGMYRVMRIGIAEDNKFRIEELIGGLPGFPDNIGRGREGRYWVGLVAPRNAILDATAEWPAVRNVIQRVPEFLRPKPERYGHLIAIDKDGNILENLQDPDGGFAMVTGAIEFNNRLYLSSLKEDSVAVLPFPETENITGQ